MLLGLAICLWGFFVAGVLGGCFPRRWLALAVSHGLTALSAALLFLLSCVLVFDASFLANSTVMAKFDFGVPWASSLFRLDSLSGLFLALLSLSVLSVSLQALIAIPPKPVKTQDLPFVGQEAPKTPKAPGAAKQKNLLSLSDPSALMIPVLALLFMALLTTDQLYLYGFGWGMLVLFFWLVTIFYANRQGLSQASSNTQALETPSRSGFVTLIFGLASLLLLLSAFGLQLQNAIPVADLERVSLLDYSFKMLQPQESGALGPVLFPLLLLLAVLCFMGLSPFHISHPLTALVLPPTLSALFQSSGMILGFYTLFRFLFMSPLGAVGAIGEDSSVLPLIPGLAFLILGAMASFFGGLQSLLQKDMRPYLSYAHQENLGSLIVFMGLGWIYHLYGLAQASLLCLTACLFLLFNHCLTQNLSFHILARLTQSSSQSPPQWSIEAFGGVARILPFLSVVLVIIFLSASAVPPFSGFSGFWTGIQAFLALGHLEVFAFLLLIPLALTCLLFAKCLGFAGRLRLYVALFLGPERPSEAPLLGQSLQDRLFFYAALSPLLLLLACFILAPGLVLTVFAEVTASLLAVQPLPREGAYRPELSLFSPLALASEDASQQEAFTPLLLLVSVIAVFLGCKRLVATPNPKKKSAATEAPSPTETNLLTNPTMAIKPPWRQGHRLTDPQEGRFRAASFSQPFRALFARPLMAAEDRVEPHLPHDPRPVASFRTVRDPFWRFFYRPTITVLDRLSAVFARLYVLKSWPEDGQRDLALVLGWLILLLCALIV